MRILNGSSMVTGVTQVPSNFHRMCCLRFTPTPTNNNNNINKNINVPAREVKQKVSFLMHQSASRITTTMVIKNSPTHIKRGATFGQLLKAWPIQLLLISLTPQQAILTKLVSRTLNSSTITESKIRIQVSPVCVFPTRWQDFVPLVCIAGTIIVPVQAC